MELITPSVELLRQGVDWQAHVAKCARVCYASIREDRNEQMVKNLMTNSHWSMFRHYSVYLIVPIKVLADVKPEHLKNPYVSYDLYYSSFYISTNGQYWFEYLKYNYPQLEEYLVDELQFINTPMGHKLARYTFKVITQISTSRELNRVSPNNIAEQSTRYVYENGKICEPHWYSQTNALAYEFLKSNYEYACDVAFDQYRTLIKNGLHRQDARGVLPLDTATICIYTYTIDEWRHIIDLRYYGTTGKPHPNAKIIAGMIRDELIGEGYDFRD